MFSTEWHSKEGRNGCRCRIERKGKVLETDRRVRWRVTVRREGFTKTEMRSKWDIWGTQKDISARGEREREREREREKWKEKAVEGKRRQVNKKRVTREKDT